jgi:mRNA interferase RelE/StbE
VTGYSVVRFDVRVPPAARRALAEQLPEAVAAAVLDFLDGPLAENPLRVGKPLVGPLAGCLGARSGTYRVIYRVDLDHRTVQVLDIDHRFAVYRRR